MTNKLLLSDYPKRDIERTRHQCQKILKNYSKQLPEILSTCLISILVPIYNETEARLRQQIKAFQKQTFLKKKFELVFIVNNPPATTKLLKKISKNNLKTIAFLKKIKSRVPIVIFDRSTIGHEIKNCNIGRARNFALHAVAKRYLTQNRDGLIIQTDADTYPIDKNYLKKVVQIFSEGRFFGASGGLKMVLSPETKNKKEYLFYKKNLQTFKNYFKWLYLTSALHKKNLDPMMTPTRFSGAHMISRAVAAICAGGVPEVSRAEDTIFGKNLEKYAKSRQTQIFPGRDVWFLQTAIRESTRTESSFGPIFENILKHNEQPLVKNPKAPILYEFITDILIYLQKNKIDKNNFSPFHEQTAFLLSDQVLLELKALKKRLINKKDGDVLYKTYKNFYQTKKNSSLPTFFRKIFYSIYPRVPLTNSALKKLKNLVYQNPKQKAFAENAIKYFTQIDLPN